MTTLLNELTFLIDFVIDNFLAIWPYLLVTIPIAAAVNLLGASKYIKRAFAASPVVAILLATAVGAFSPLCSCTVIPVVAALLLGGVPLAPVMAFWIASPSMDPEIFFLSAAVLGWPLAVWRLIAALLISLAAGYLTHLAVERGWLGADLLRARGAEPLSIRAAGGRMLGWLKEQLHLSPTPVFVGASLAYETEGGGCASGSCALPPQPAPLPNDPAPNWRTPAFRRRLGRETAEATWFVVRFMLLAFVLEALLVRYVPQDWIVSLLGGGNPAAIPAAALLGVPIYTSNLTALPLIGGLLEQGMSPGAALAFLIAGPMTTLPAMTAVWQLVTRRVFALYVSFALFGALLSGYLLAWLG